MVTSLTRERPEFLVELLRETVQFELPYGPNAQPHAESGELTQTDPVQYRADQVMMFTDPSRSNPKDPNSRNAHAVVVEVQRKRDPQKLYSWPAYLVLLREQKKCDTSLVVVCTEAPVATWAAQPIETGHPGFVLTPLVIGPHNTPYIVDPDRAIEEPELAMTSALVHASEETEGSRVLDAVITGFGQKFE